MSEQIPCETCILDPTCRVACPIFPFHSLAERWFPYRYYERCLAYADKHLSSFERRAYPGGLLVTKGISTVTAQIKPLGITINKSDGHIRLRIDATDDSPSYEFTPSTSIAIGDQTRILIIESDSHMERMGPDKKFLNICDQHLSVLQNEKSRTVHVFRWSGFEKLLPDNRRFPLWPLWSDGRADIYKNGNVQHYSKSHHIDYGEKSIFVENGCQAGIDDYIEVTPEKGIWYSVKRGPRPFFVDNEKVIINMGKYNLSLGMDGTAQYKNRE